MLKKTGKTIVTTMFMATGLKKASQGKPAAAAGCLCEVLNGDGEGHACQCQPILVNTTGHSGPACVSCHDKVQKHVDVMLGFPRLQHEPHLFGGIPPFFMRVCSFM